MQTYAPSTTLSLALALLATELLGPRELRCHFKAEARQGALDSVPADGPKQCRAPSTSFHRPTPDSHTREPERRRF